jgi:hypothetical protein
VVTKGVHPLLEYMCCQTWYQSTFEDHSLVVDRDLEVVVTSLVSAISIHFWDERTIPLHLECSFQL